jgi:2-oxoglutarate ferredoxin oxidoreductase subunit alpha
LTIDAFNLSEQYRVPVLLMMDECVGHMTEKVVIPEAEEIELVPRRYTQKPPGKYLPYEPCEDLVPEIIKAGDGYRIHSTGLTHDERGYPVMSAEAQNKLVRRLVDKIRKNAEKIIRIEEHDTDTAEVVVVSYGITNRVVQAALADARKAGIKVGDLKLVTVWPFPERRIAELATRVKAFVVPEINFGQIILEVERCARGKVPCYPVSHGGGGVHEPDDILKVSEEAVR